MNALQKVLSNLFWVITYPINILTGAKNFGSHNERLAARPKWLIQAFFVGFAAFQLTYWFLPLFVRGLPPFMIPLTVAGFMIFSHQIGGLPDSTKSGDAFSRAKRWSIFQNTNTARQIFGCGFFWAGAASLLLWRIF